MSPIPNYAGKERFEFRIHNCLAFSKNAQVSIKMEKSEESNTDQVQQNDKQQPNNEQSSQTPTDQKKPTDGKSNDRLLQAIQAISRVLLKIPGSRKVM